MIEAFVGITLGGLLLHWFYSSEATTHERAEMWWVARTMKDPKVAITLLREMSTVTFFKHFIRKLTFRDASSIYPTFENHGYFNEV